MKTVTTLLCAIPMVLLVGCANMTPEEQSVLSGSALGAVGGAALGALSGHAGEGAMIGAGVGALGGAMQSTNNQPRPRARAPQRRTVRESYEEEICYDNGECEIHVHHYE